MASPLCTISLKRNSPDARTKSKQTEDHGARMVALFTRRRELLFHIQRAFDRIHAIWSDLAKSIFAVELDRFRHYRWHGVEPNARVSDRARLIEQMFD